MNKLAPIYSMLERIMIRGKKFHKQVHVPGNGQVTSMKVFDLLHKEIISLTKYGIKVVE